MSVHLLQDDSYNKVNCSFVDDVGGDALARCSDCTNYPAAAECCKYLDTLKVLSSVHIYTPPKSVDFVYKTKH